MLGEHGAATVEIEEKECNVLSNQCLSEGNSVSDLVQQNSSHASEGTRKGGKDVNTTNKSNRTRSANSVSKNEHCISALQCEEQDDQKLAGVRQTCNSKGKNQDLNRVFTSGSNVFRMKRLGMPPLCAVEGVTRRLAPLTSWSEKEETVHITIHLVGVEQYKCCVSLSHLTFM